jgi:hypothetical protein
MVYTVAMMVITVEATSFVPPSVALTKMPTVPAVVPAVNVSEAPLPLIDPIVVLERAQTYEMFPGQVALHVGVALKSCFPPMATVGVSGLTATETRLMGAVVTVITVDASLVVPLSEALTKSPAVPAVVPALKVTVLPLPLRDPSAMLVSDQVYKMVPGQVALHTGVAVNGVDVPEPTVGARGLKATELRVIGTLVTVITVEASLVVPLRVALT